MTWSIWIRKAHRWVSLAFTLAVVANMAAMALGRSELWIGLLALVPLMLLLISGLYLFLLPYRATSRGSRAAAGEMSTR